MTLESSYYIGQENAVIGAKTGSDIHRDGEANISEIETAQSASTANMEYPT